MGNVGVMSKICWKYISPDTLKMINLALGHTIVYVTIKHLILCKGYMAVMSKILGRSLMIGWRKNSWNHERVPTVVTFVCVCLCVCVSVCTRATDHSFRASNLIFGLSDPWDMRMSCFFCFSKFSFLRFFRHFSFFSPYITLVIFLFQATGHNFSPRNVMFRAITQICLIPLGPWNTKIKVLCVRILCMQIMPGSRSTKSY